MSSYTKTVFTQLMLTLKITRYITSHPFFHLPSFFRGVRSLSECVGARSGRGGSRSQSSHIANENPSVREPHVHFQFTTFCISVKYVGSLPPPLLGEALPFLTLHLINNFPTIKPQKIPVVRVWVPTAVGVLTERV
jgi:hypothetical protein